MKIILALILLILIAEVSALKIGISPSKLYFRGQIGEELCKSLTFYSDSSVSFTAKDKWNPEKFSDVVGDYNLNSSEINLEVSYPDAFSFKSSKKADVCITSYTNKSYYGVLIYSVENGNSGIGILMKADFSGKGEFVDLEEEKEFVEMTEATKNLMPLDESSGMAISSAKSPERNLSFLFLILTTSNLSSLLFLLKVSEKKKVVIK